MPFVTSITPAVTLLPSHLPSFCLFICIPPSFPPSFNHLIPASVLTSVHSFFPSLPPSAHPSLPSSLHNEALFARRPEAMICCHYLLRVCVCVCGPGSVCGTEGIRGLYLQRERAKEREMNVECVVKLDVKVIQPPVLLQRVWKCVCVCVKGCSRGSWVVFGNMSFVVELLDTHTHKHTREDEAEI